ncbi:hypothetical protein AMES_5662 [Amycolatopsis mediterranei S699]|uniref:DUF4383 domain-containing protein n=2 Tax=Amycolatopsis mediterranei TaxID=33910 RepID=A0A0H3DB31_AMYMU|nr:DUF4383 domain-containing protein [Amycolatopsis mediterranei]ADJ47487.1 conserved hypothetical protein [Amycolatopsis mediterranei U32]AEK44339.1 hypothetical protein RAM_29310 [Amycolatopsis mediterranei S699]AFO79198.1 hypothetical protein AMES_5662 [Amycolatopsis mediterranei S699]AGT86326.1 hypothetical protein B737_5662 [Amycolatopsis mediterranei RB]KDO12586.1 membrane protein [Amycolatopsis mediterranei]
MTETPRTTKPATFLVQRTTAVVGAIFLIVGVLGFIPGITTHYDQLQFAGHHSMAQLFDVFTVSVLHNLVHLLFGVVGVIAARYPGGSRAYLMIGGLVYLILCVYGLGTDSAGAPNFVPVNDADNWLHLGLGVGMIALGIGCTALDRRRGDFPPRDVRKA